MAKIVLTTILIVSLSLSTGCRPYNSGSGQLVVSQPSHTAATTGVPTNEIDIVEQVVNNRQNYRQSLETLAQYYSSIGNYMKQQWAKKELEGLDTMPKYKYIVEGEKNENLKASTPISDADTLYNEALQIQKKAEQLVVIKDEKLLRIALDKYDQLINKFPTSDKIDDAAYNSGEIYDYFKDYTIALSYYKRAFQWNPDTPYPARFRAAYILDKQLHSRAEALELYQQSQEKEGTLLNYEQRLFVENRIKELQKLNEGTK